MDKQIVAIDFETFFSKDYSLSKLSARDYIHDPRFEPLLVAIKVGDGPTTLHEGDDIEPALRAIDWEDSYCLAHNVKFDGAILAWHYGIHPGAFLDTMAMTQATIAAFTGRASLASAAKYFKFVDKGDGLVVSLGKHRTDFTEAEWASFREYCAHDNNLCVSVFKAICGKFRYPPSEFRLIDLDVKSYLRPMIGLNVGLLRQHLANEREQKQELLDTALAAAGATPEDLRSSKKFAAILESQGVDVPMKISPTNGKLTFAFAKTDPDFIALADDHDPTIRTLIAARIGAKSTLEETRTERFLDIAEKYGTLHIPLKYHGARTGRFSGSEKLNIQNLRRGSELRRSLTAPDGWSFVVADASQIEARVLAEVAGETSVVDAFRDGEDVYCMFASRVFGREITKADTAERFVGKTSILGLGYGVGRERFLLSLRSTARKEGIAYEVTEEIAERAHTLYRGAYTRITGLWRDASGWIELMPGLGVTLNYGPLGVAKNRIELPNGMALRYPGLRLDVDDYGGNYIYNRGKRTYRLYGSKLVENIIQALAGVITFSAIPRTVDRAKSEGLEVRFCFSIHDELIFLARDEHAERLETILVNEMSCPPVWLPGLPLAAESGIGKNYGDAK